MKVLSLFDGMACGALALQAANIEIESYDAFEIDNYAIKTASHNFPFIKHHGDVFNADFTQFKGVDLVCGGSPCTYWSIAQKNNRETEASGMGWELFQQFVRAIKEAQPKFFVYENNKSMSKAIRQSIDDAFGFESVLINSALVSAQNRQRLYWVGKRNEDGTYSKVNVEQPVDRGILLCDVLDGMTDREKSRAIIGSIGRTTTREYFKKQQNTMTFEPINTTDDGQKARTLMAGYYKYGTATLITNKGFKGGTTAIAEPINTTPAGKSQTLKAQYCKNNVSNFCCYSSTYGASGVAEPVNITPEGKSIALKAQYHNDNISNFVVHQDAYGYKSSGVAEPVRVGALPRPNGELSTSQAMRIYGTEGKCVNLTAGGGGLGGKTGLYAIPVEFNGDIPTKARSGSDGKLYDVYEVKNGLITIKGKQYEIKLADGFYIIRKLTVSECKRLQTVPEWYEFPVSDTQAYKMLGNGWSVNVISHRLKSLSEV